MATPTCSSIRTLSRLLRTPKSSSRYLSSTSRNQTSSVNPTEVSHFNALASTWWDPHGSSRLLHLMNPLRHDFINACLASEAASHPSPTPVATPKKYKYLDIGCGGGIFAESAARLPHTTSVLALDPSPQVLNIAKAHARKDPVLQQPGRLTYLNTTIENLPIPATPEAQFDIVTCFEVIEHVETPSTFLRNCLKHVKPGGWMVMSTIARTWTSWIVTKVVAEELLGVVPKGTHEWGKYLNEDELRGFFNAEKGWRDNIRSQGCAYIPGLGWKMVPGGEKMGNYFIAARKDPES